MIKKSHTYHVPVLLQESLNALQVKPDGVYVDATFGGGGHSRPILSQMTAKGRLFGFDQDVEAFKNAIDDSRFVFIHSNFQFLLQFMKYYEAMQLDGIIADLGVSSYHFDKASRGFSYRFEDRLDMRMNQSSQLSAIDVLNKYSEEDLQRIFSQYGELRNAKTLSRHICKRREYKGVERTSDLLEIIDVVYKGDRLKYISQVFQAIRIEVNDELNVLEKFLIDGLSLLKSDGRFIVITYHSLEDAIVKKVMRLFCSQTDDFGRNTSKFELINKRPIVPSKDEIVKNRRASSAKLRAIKKK